MSRFISWGGSRRKKRSATFGWQDHRVGRIGPDSDEGSAMLEDEGLKKRKGWITRRRAQRSPIDHERQRELPSASNTRSMDGWILYLNRVKESLEREWESVSMSMSSALWVWSVLSFHERRDPMATIHIYVSLASRYFLHSGSFNLMSWPNKLKAKNTFSYFSRTLGWSLWRLVWRIFFRCIISKTIKNMQNRDFWQKGHFL